MPHLPNKMRSIFMIIFIMTLATIRANAQVVTDSTASDSAMLRQVEAQMQLNAPPVIEQVRTSPSTNPDISVIGDFRGSYDSRGKRNVDAYLNETELSLQSVVDPYLRADFFLTLGRNPETGKYGAAVEEGYITTLALPHKLQLKAGKFREAVGRINPMHPHALPFIDIPNAFVNYFGEEGLNDEGVSLSWLVPNKKFYQELIVQATSGAEQSPTFHRGDNNRFLYLAHLKNFFTLSGNATLEFGITGITGPNDSSAITNMGTADLTYKWKPVQMNTYRSLTWQTEFFYSNAKYAADQAHNTMGLYSLLEYQVAKRWFLTGRYDLAQKPYNKELQEQAYSLTAGWLATEFQKIEFEAKTTHDDLLGQYNQAWLRWIFVIGAHGAHQY